MPKLPDEKSFGAEPGAVTLPQADTKNTRGIQSFLITVVPENSWQAGSAILLYESDHEQPQDKSEVIIGG